MGKRNYISQDSRLGIGSRAGQPAIQVTTPLYHAPTDMKTRKNKRERERGQERQRGRSMEMLVLALGGCQGPRRATKVSDAPWSSARELKEREREGWKRNREG